VLYGHSIFLGAFIFEILRLKIDDKNMKILKPTMSICTTILPQEHNFQQGDHAPLLP